MSNINALIVGFGTVGQALFSLLNDDTAKYYDIKINEYEPWWNAYNLIFICIPIPSKDGKQDISNLEDLIKKIHKNNDKCLVVIKSTILYENFLKLKNIHERIIVNPEFLNEISAFEDIKSQPILIGGQIDSVNILKNYYLNCIGFDKDIDFEICTAEQACNFKFTHNLYSIWKLLFWEMIQDITSDERKMYKLYKKFKTGDMGVVGLDGYRGIGGKCFPDNLECVKTKHKLLQELYNYNNALGAKND